MQIPSWERSTDTGVRAMPLPQLRRPLARQRAVVRPPPGRRSAKTRGAQLQRHGCVPTNVAPRGPADYTRCPSVLQLLHVSDDPTTRAVEMHTTAPQRHASHAHRRDVGMLKHIRKNICNCPGSFVRRLLVHPTHVPLQILSGKRALHNMFEEIQTNTKYLETL